MKLLKKVKTYIQEAYWVWEYTIKHKIQVWRWKRKYPDYEDNEYNFGSLKHIWGITSWDDLTGKSSCLHSMNDISITYNRENRQYILGVETAYLFKDRKSECKYLREMLSAFAHYMDQNGLSIECNRGLFCRGVAADQRAESIEELYENFRIFVEGYCKVYESV